MNTDNENNQFTEEDKENIKEEKTPAAEDKKEEKKSRKDRKADEKKTIEELEAKHAEELRAVNDKYMRLLAEYDNFRKRSMKERDGLYADIKSDTVTKFLPVFDNLERALAQSTEDEAYRKGVEMIMNQFNQTLEKLGVTEIESMGAAFDPTVHNAVMHVEDETKGENEIVDVFQKGFKLGDKVIRFSMVKVAN